jgi:hypothetical protein
MMRLLRLAAAVSLFSGVAGAQEDPLAWFPLQGGSRWVYEHEWKSGNRQSPNVERWTSQESITGTVSIPEGLVVLREVKRLGKPARAGSAYLVARDQSPYLVRGNCVYVIDNGFDRQSRKLREDYRKYLAEGSIAPDFCFPLEPGRRWGNTDVCWRVEPASHNHPGAVHLFSDHFGSGGLKDVWFQNGVGVVREHYRHNGSYDEYTRTLVSFSRHVARPATASER